MTTPDSTTAAAKTTSKRNSKEHHNSCAYLTTHSSMTRGGTLRKDLQVPLARDDNCKNAEVCCNDQENNEMNATQTNSLSLNRYEFHFRIPTEEIVNVTSPQSRHKLIAHRITDYNTNSNR
uniref:Uncharacterized protein n=1 Tax=Lygus hesperus TaxID=30085 RepID=A0A0A9WFW8_LYGHE